MRVTTQQPTTNPKPLVSPLLKMGQADPHIHHGDRRILQPASPEMSFFQKIGLVFSSKPIHIIEHAKVLLDNGRFAPRTVIVEGNKIAAITDHFPKLLSKIRPVQYTEGKGMLVTPGLIDQHTHGALGCDFNTASPAEIKLLLNRLPAYGITGILATLMTGPLEDMKQAIGRISQLASQPLAGKTRILGLHLEGPFINKDYKGAHLETQLHTPAVPKMQPMLNPFIKMVTLAPELDQNFALTKFLTQHGVRVSAGHSCISFDQMQEAVKAGVSGVTHLFNAMPQLHHRNPGLVGAALSIPHLKTELIADGIHVNPFVLKTAIRNKLQDVILVSDSMALAGLPNGTKGIFGGQPVHVHNNAVHLCCDSSRLAGSSAMLNQCVQNISRWGITDFAYAVLMASKNPANFLGFSQLGNLRPNATADMVVWDEKTFDVKQTWIDGEKVYEANSQPVAVLAQ